MFSAKHFHRISGLMRSLFVISKNGQNRGIVTRRNTLSNNNNKLLNVLPLDPQLKSMKNLSIYYQNVGGMKSKLNLLYLSSVSCLYDIVILVETWLNDSVFDNEIFSNDYFVYRCDRNTKNCPNKISGGGVLIAVRSIYGSNLITSSFSDVIEQLCVKVTFSNTEMLFFGCYIPPKSSTELYSNHTDSIKEIVDVNEEINIFIFGDFNLPKLEWYASLDETEKFLLPINVSNDEESCVVDSFALMDLMQINSFYNSNCNMLDLIFTNAVMNSSVNVVEIPLIPAYLKHHLPMAVDVTIDEKVNLMDCSEFQYDFKSCDFSSLNFKLKEIIWDFGSFADINEATNHLYEVIFNCVMLTTPLKKKFYTNRPPWFNSDLAKIRNARNNAAKKDRNLFRFLRSEFNALNLLSYKQYIEKTQIEIKSNPKTFWTFINSKKKSNGFPSIMNYDNIDSSSPQTIVDMFADFFKSVYQNDNQLNSNELNQTVFPCYDIRTSVVSESDVLNIISSLNESVSSGPDGLPPIFLKKCASGIVKPLTQLFNWSLTSGVFPEKWKLSFLKPIFKAGRRNDIRNYRGIAKLSIIPKLFEKLVYDQLYDQVGNFISDYQHGFMKRKSTSTNLLEFTSSAIKRIEKGSQIDTIYTDFSKAFDRISHSILLYKLERYGFSTNIINWIGSYLRNRHQLVKMDAFRSSTFPVTSGVPQGSHLGPLLFNVLINDIVQVIDCEVLLFADDMKIYSSISDSNDCLRLQTDINNIFNWCKVNKIDLNISKCKAITFSRKAKPFDYDYHINGELLTRVTEINDLGVLLDSKMNFKLHFGSVVNKANRMLGFINRSSKDFDDPFALRSLYFCFVRSVLEYASVVWTPYYKVDITRLERIQKRFTRFALRPLRWTDQLPPYNTRLVLLNLLSLESRRTSFCAMFIRDLLQSKILSPVLLSRLKFKFGRTLRSQFCLYAEPHRTNYGYREPVNNMIMEFNNFYFLFDLNISREMFKQSITNYVKN